MLKSILHFLKESEGKRRAEGPHALHSQSVAYPIMSSDENIELGWMRKYLTADTQRLTLTGYVDVNRRLCQRMSAYVSG